MTTGEILGLRWPISSASGEANLGMVYCPVTKVALSSKAPEFNFDPLYGKVDKGAATVTVSVYHHRPMEMDVVFASGRSKRTYVIRLVDASYSTLAEVLYTSVRNFVETFDAPRKMGSFNWSYFDEHKLRTKVTDHISFLSEEVKTKSGKTPSRSSFPTGAFLNSSPVSVRIPEGSKTLHVAVKDDSVELSFPMEGEVVNFALAESHSYAMSPGMFATLMGNRVIISPEKPVGSSIQKGGGGLSKTQAAQFMAGFTPYHAIGSDLMSDKSLLGKVIRRTVDGSRKSALTVIQSLQADDVVNVNWSRDDFSFNAGVYKCLRDVVFVDNTVGELHIQGFGQEMTLQSLDATLASYVKSEIEAKAPLFGIAFSAYHHLKVMRAKLHQPLPPLAWAANVNSEHLTLIQKNLKAISEHGFVSTGPVCQDDILGLSPDEFGLGEMAIERKLVTKVQAGKLYRETVLSVCGVGREVKCVYLHGEPFALVFEGERLNAIHYLGKQNTGVLRADDRFEVGHGNSYLVTPHGLITSGIKGEVKGVFSEKTSGMKVPVPLRGTADFAAPSFCQIVVDAGAEWEIAESTNLQQGRMTAKLATVLCSMFGFLPAKGKPIDTTLRIMSTMSVELVPGSPVQVRCDCSDCRPYNCAVEKLCCKFEIAEGNFCSATAYLSRNGMTCPKTLIQLEVLSYVAATQYGMVQVDPSNFNLLVSEMDNE